MFNLFSFLLCVLEKKHLKHVKANRNNVQQKRNHLLYSSTHCWRVSIVEDAAMSRQDTEALYIVELYLI